MSYIPDYTGFKAVTEKISFILGQMPDGDPDKPYDKDFEIELNPKSSKAKKAEASIIKIIRKRRMQWSRIGQDKMLIKEPTANALEDIFNILDNKVISGMGWAMDESVDETMAYKKAQKFTKKLNDDALLKDLIYVANKIHDKMGTNDDVQEWLKTVITYGNNHPQQWHESLDEAAPKMTVDPDAEYVSSVISRLGVIGRNATGPNVKKAITKALKTLQNLRSSIQVGR
jgi:hypothetical protein